MNLFLDTNAVVKLYHHEEGTENLTKFLFENSEDLVITISDLTKIELHSALLKRNRQKEINLEALKEIFNTFEKDFRAFNIVTIDVVVKNFAIQLIDNFAINHSLRTLDSLQLSSALVANNFNKIDYFISSDKKLLSVAKLFFQVKDPQDI